MVQPPFHRPAIVTHRPVTNTLPPCNPHQINLDDAKKIRYVERFAYQCGRGNKPRPKITAITDNDQQDRQ